MSWSDFHERRAAIKAVLRHAEERPSAQLPFAQLPEVSAIFASPAELLMALQYDWSQALWAQIELLTLDTDTTFPPAATPALPGGLPMDASAACRQAWQNTAEQHPTLRRLLDEHLAEVSNRDREQSLLVSAGIGHSAHAGGRRHMIA